MGNYNWETLLSLLEISNVMLKAILTYSNHLITGSFNLSVTEALVLMPLAFYSWATVKLTERCAGQTIYTARTSLSPDRDTAACTKSCARILAGEIAPPSGVTTFQAHRGYYLNTQRNL